MAANKEKSSWLNTPPSSAVNPPIETRVSLLPFDQISWQDFERLCSRLVRLEANVEYSTLYGVQGEDQSGIDIFARVTVGAVIVCEAFLGFSGDDAAADSAGEEAAGRVEMITFSRVKSTVKNILGEVKYFLCHQCRMFSLIYLDDTDNKIRTMCGFVSEVYFSNAIFQISRVRFSPSEQALYKPVRLLKHL